MKASSRADRVTLSDAGIISGDAARASQRIVRCSMASIFAEAGVGGAPGDRWSHAGIARHPYDEPSVCQCLSGWRAAVRGPGPGHRDIAALRPSRRGGMGLTGMMRLAGADAGGWAG